MDNIGIVIISILFAVAVFLILREFWCWYFKINETNKLLSDILAQLQKNNCSTTDIESVKTVIETVNKNQNKTKKNLPEEKKERLNKDEIIDEDAVEDPFWNKKR